MVVVEVETKDNGGWEKSTTYGALYSCVGGLSGEIFLLLLFRFITTNTTINIKSLIEVAIVKFQIYMFEDHLKTKIYSWNFSTTP